jgi:hypothetical protein
VSYAVVWSPTAERELMGLVTNDPAPGEIIVAAQALNQLLEVNAPEIGESRDPGERAAFFAPLGIRFEVNVRFQTARVLHVWRRRRR